MQVYFEGKKGIYLRDLPNSIGFYYLFNIKQVFWVDAKFITESKALQLWECCFIIYRAGRKEILNEKMQK